MTCSPPVQAPKAVAVIPLVTTALPLGNTSLGEPVPEGGSSSLVPSSSSSSLDSSSSSSLDSLVLSLLIALAAILGVIVVANIYTLGQVQSGSKLFIYQVRESTLVPAGFLTAQFLQKL